MGLVEFECEEPEDVAHETTPIQVCRKPYTMPMVTDYGDVAQLTNGLEGSAADMAGGMQPV